MSIKTNDSHQTSNFWFGFSLGALFIIIGTMIFGTKKGRETLKKFLEISENFEENISKILEKTNSQEETKKNTVNLFAILKKLKN
ncbi:MAG: hypothetical protein N2482_01220 [Patescibacteria group bacterium]|nr:hypothetical protein [Patescibacteria group bacterium]